MPSFRPSAGGVDAGRDGATADGDEDVVAFDALGLSVLLDVDEDAGLGATAAGDARAGANVEALLAEDAVRLFHDVVVHAREDGGQQLDDGDLGAEPLPDRSELEADDAAADDDEVGGDARDFERADVREDSVFVELEEGELDWYGAGGNDDVFCLVRGDCLLGGAPRRAAARHLDHIPGAQRPAPLRPRDLVLAKQELDALRVLPDDVVLPLEHRVEIERQLPDPDAVRRRRVLSKLIMLGRRQQRLRRNAADVDARAAERLVHLDADGRQAQLRGPDRGDISARPTADDDDVGRDEGRAVWMSWRRKFP